MNACMHARDVMQCHVCMQGVVYVIVCMYACTSVKDVCSPVCVCVCMHAIHAMYVLNACMCVCVYVMSVV